MTSVTKRQALNILSESDVVAVRQFTRQWAVEMKFSIVDQTKLVTAASELARNALVHGGGGVVQLEALLDNGRTGLRLIFEDHGQGIPDLDLAMKDGYTTGGGLGLGLGGAKRLVNDFQIDTRVGQGTRVTAVRWKIGS